MWHRRHQRVVTLLAFATLVLLAWRYWHAPNVAPLPGQPGELARNATLHLDPNTASEQDLAALPGMGQSRARALVAYRDKRREETGEATVFNRLEDLDPIKGLGEAGLEKLRPNLIFPEPGK